MQTVFISKLENFYSRPCGRGDVAVSRSYNSLVVISTHAPAGGATMMADGIPIAATISTHAPAGGATRMVRKDCQR